MSKKSMHGTSKAKGCSHLGLGNFTRLAADEKAWANTCCGAGPIPQCKAEEVAAFLGGANGLMRDLTGDQNVDAKNLPAGYTFFAQFLDHDITLDTTTKLHGCALNHHEVSELPNLRSASLDLDCVYGFGPEAHPFMYDESQPGRLAVGNHANGVYNPNDLPRNEEGRAMIGDPRNDENLFVSQMQLLWIRFHNRLLIGSNFEEAQKEARYHYQWIVLHDFLKRVVHPDIYDFAKQKIEENACKDPCNRDYPFCRKELTDPCGRILMPVEFSVAAYRFGHSTVRSSYPVNADFPNIGLFDERFGTLGFGQVPPELAVDWRFLLDVHKCPEPTCARAINRFLADELFRLPDPVVTSNAFPLDRSLAFRNILRGYVLGLPSGQTMAKLMDGKGYDIRPLVPEDFTDIKGWECAPKLDGCKLEENTPLFFYLMHEADLQGGGQTLGTVGSAILMEVFGAMLLSCNTYLTECKGWKPKACIAYDGEMTLKDIVHFVD